MGYYSDVAITMGYEDFRALVGKFKDEKDTYEFLRYAEISRIHDYDAVTVQWNAIKWFETLSSPCGRIMKYLHSEDVPFYFLRVGEEIDDMECYAEGDGAWDYADIIQISRRIEFWEMSEPSDIEEITNE